MLMTNKLTLPVESRMQGDLHVRFGGRLWETYHRKVVRRPSPSLHASYAENPAISTVEIEAPATPAAAAEPAEGRVLLQEVGREKPATVKRILADIYRLNRVDTKGIRAKRYGIEVEVLGIYIHNDVIYVHTVISNTTNISFEVDYRRFNIEDKKITKRTAQQRTPLEVLRVCNDPAVVRGHQRQRSVFALPKFTIPNDKVLILEIVERNGARHQTVEISAKELLDAKVI